MHFRAAFSQMSAQQGEENVIRYAFMSVQQHMKEIYYSETKASVQKCPNTLNISNKHICAIYYSASVKSLIMTFFLHYYMVFARSAHKDICCFICRNLTTLGIRSVLQSIRIFNSSPIFKISLHAALLSTLCYPYNTPEHQRNAFLALYLLQG